MMPSPHPPFISSLVDFPLCFNLRCQLELTRQFTGQGRWLPSTLDLLSNILLVSLLLCSYEKRCHLGTEHGGERRGMKMPRWRRLDSEVGKLAHTVCGVCLVYRASYSISLYQHRVVCSKTFAGSVLML